MQRRTVKDTQVSQAHRDKQEIGIARNVAGEPNILIKGREKYSFRLLQPSPALQCQLFPPGIVVADMQYVAFSKGN